MKTRIRKKEYKNGRIDYICESESLKTESIACILCGTIVFLFILLGGFLFSTLPNGNESIEPLPFIFLWTSLIFSIYGIVQYSERWEKIHSLDSECVFNNLEEAKKAIDGHVFRCKQDKEKREGEKTKKTTIIKYP